MNLNIDKMSMADFAKSLQEQVKVRAIAKQNDRFRSTWGADFTIGGQIVFTQSVSAESVAWTTAIMAAVQRFSDFNEDNDPYGDHSFAAVDVTVGGETKKVFFKIDLYDLTYKNGSEHPTDLDQTRRVMTIMFPSDY